MATAALDEWPVAPPPPGVAAVVDQAAQASSSGMAGPSGFVCSPGRDAVTDDVDVARVLPFLFLGSADAAQDAAFLQRANIKLIVNLSGTGYWVKDPDITVVRLEINDHSDADIVAVIRKALKPLTLGKDRWASATESRVSLESRTPTRTTSVARAPPPGRSGTSGSSNDGSNPDDAEAPGEVGSATDPQVADIPPLAAASSSGDPPCVLVHCLKGISRSTSVVVAYLMVQNGWALEEALAFVQHKRPQAQPNLGFMMALQRFETELTDDPRGKYDRKVLHKERLVLLRNVEGSSDAHLATTFAPYGDVVKVERHGQVAAVQFSMRNGKRWAERAIRASLDLRIALSGNAEAPARRVQL